jgi:hypothetical protein
MTCIRGANRPACTLALLACATACNGDPPPDPEPPSFELALETDDGALLSVWGESADDVWAVGGQPRTDDMTPGQGLLLHWDGEAWSTETLPADTPMLNWVFGTGDALWIVGEDGAALRRDGSDWAPVITGTDVPLWGLWGVGEQDLWTVGGDPFEGPPIILHWDGSAWTEESIPMLDRESDAMFKVWGAAADDVWVVGDAGVVLHWDGSEFTQVLAGTGADLISVWGTGSDEVLAVGGRSSGTLTRWDGQSWTAETIGELAGLNGVWMDGAGVSTVVGNFAALATVEAGKNEAEILESGAGANVLHGVFGFDDGSRFAVGGSLLTPPPWGGVIVQRAAD